MLGSYIPPANQEIQMDLLANHLTNAELYPWFHDFSGKPRVPLLAVGVRMISFSRPWERKLVRSTFRILRLHLLGAGQLALETNGIQISELKFLCKNGI
jgi:hypothetical protein